MEIEKEGADEFHPKVFLRLVAFTPDFGQGALSSAVQRWMDSDEESTNAPASTSVEQASKRQDGVASEASSAATFIHTVFG